MLHLSRTDAYAVMIADVGVIPILLHIDLKLSHFSFESDIFFLPNLTFSEYLFLSALLHIGSCGALGIVSIFSSQ